MAGTRGAARLSALAVLAVVLLVLSPLPAADRLEERAGAIAGRPVAALRAATQPLAELFLRAGQLDRLSDENAALREEVARLQSALAALREDEIAADQLRDLQRGSNLPVDAFVTASVLLHDPAPGRHTLLIDHGTADGVRAGQPVLGAGSTLVGLIAAAGEHRSRVRLLIDPASAVAGVVQSSRTVVAVSGTGERRLRLEFVEAEQRVVPGDLIVTSALGGDLPGGLLIGRVSEVQHSRQRVVQDVTVDPLSDGRQLEHLLVMTGFRPATTLSVEADSTEDR